MFKRFVDGLAFGAGFSIAFIVLWTIVSFVVFPAYIKSRVADAGGSETAFPNAVESTPEHFSSAKSEAPFYTLSIEEQIAEASVIAHAKYRQADDGRMQAIITEFLKLDPGTKIRYAVGDEYPGSSYYPTGDHDRGDGVIIFFTGSPATMELATSVNGDRISGLNDIPLKLFREKCGKVGS